MFIVIGRKYKYIEVYRGVNSKNREDGLSYTFDLKVAKFFANRWCDSGRVNKYKVPIDDVVAYINNGEDEILTNNAEFLYTADICD